jgi:retron-type reverse transcriptase
MLPIIDTKVGKSPTIFYMRFKYNMFQYTEELKKILIQNNYNEKYINLCEQYCNRLLQNNLPVIFDKNHFALLLGLEKNYLDNLFFLSDKLYNIVKIPKKSGSYRQISIPTEGLKFVQRWLLDNILYMIKISNYATGFVPHLSTYYNALKHVNKECIFNIDLKDFFPSIRLERIFRIFNYYGYTKELSYMFSKLCTYNDRLPQGAPTSPCLSNIVCKKLDKRLGLIAIKLKCNYTRYADDITFSGDNYIVKYKKIFEDIITDEGFEINRDKTRIQFRDDRQVVTGLVVNDKVSVPKEIKRYLRQQIYYCKVLGVDKHIRNSEIIYSNYKEHLFGIASYINMIDKDQGVKYFKDLNCIKWDY